MKSALINTRSAPSWYTPPDLPPEIRAFDTPVDHLGVGAAGKVGLLELELAPVDGATRIVRQFQQMPLYMFHPLYIDPGWPEMAFVYMLQSGEGIVQGDRYRLDLHCAPRAAAHFTTQAATKIYRMENNFASQVVNLNVGAEAYAEYLPDPIIPFQAARFYQRMCLTIGSGGSAIVGEVLLPGRVARGELHSYSMFYSDLEAWTPDGALLFADRVKLEPDSMPVYSPGLLGAHNVLATLYVVSRITPPATLVQRLRDRLANDLDLLCGVSELPNGFGAIVRTLGQKSERTVAAIRLAWNEARLALGRAPAPTIRK